MNTPIVVVDYDPQWPEAFATIRTSLDHALAEVATVAIEHVGSTSVPDLVAKPIIDIDVIVEQSNVGDAVAALESIGYTSLGDLGVPGRYALQAPQGAVRHNTYVTVNGCLSLRNHLGLRDVLRSDPELRDEYSSVKRRLVTETDDIDVYIDGKTHIIQRILERAGLGRNDLVEIEGLNRL
jgi:GrpB-like predicted nucleotidyltransferase (UPF0157 family)